MELLLLVKALAGTSEEWRCLLISPTLPNPTKRFGGTSPPPSFYARYAPEMHKTVLYTVQYTTGLSRPWLAGQIWLFAKCFVLCEGGNYCIEFGYNFWQCTSARVVYWLLINDVHIVQYTSLTLNNYKFLSCRLHLTEFTNWFSTSTAGASPGFWFEGGREHGQNFIHEFNSSPVLVLVQYNHTMYTSGDARISVRGDIQQKFIQQGLLKKF